MGDWIQTFSGRRFWPADPRVDEVNIYDIAHSLSMQCRYGGHVRRFYSVAEHCVILSYAVPKEFALAALLHDASEAYVVDVPRPIKNMLPVYQLMENEVIAAIYKRFGLPYLDIPEIVQEYDTRILLNERDALMWPSGIKWQQDELEPLDDIQFRCWSPEAAEANYLNRLSELTAHIRRDFLPVLPEA